MVEATVSLEFESWGKLQMALAAGSQQMNLLRTAAGAAANGSGGVAAAAVALSAGSTATALNVGADGGGGVQCWGALLRWMWIMWGRWGLWGAVRVRRMCGRLRMLGVT